MNDWNNFNDIFRKDVTYYNMKIYEKQDFTDLENTF